MTEPIFFIGGKKLINQSEHEAKPLSTRAARAGKSGGNQITFGFGFASDWLKRLYTYCDWLTYVTKLNVLSLALLRSKTVRFKAYCAKMQCQSNV